MESLPAALVSFIELLRPLFRAEVFASFCYLMMGILIGEAKSGTVRASVFAGSAFAIFARAIAEGAVVRAVPAPGAVRQPRSFFDRVVGFAQATSDLEEIFLKVTGQDGSEAAA